ncbi:EAL and modified HD-GYP domain-containing signal transduction protein [Actinoplanes campanulatus]|uniref:EAL and modified HD-GYP domain-containing signal transduction protein n=1 Tax=Actinoplanes campanulatus TaxID=113559 RepID=A0A7W5AF68_9ACTN|nr:HDOD domain-containing protein [Actinoplanes campanulatus]MBB3094905.1 EAL and modified HD-GYP domain-containing signal transduction protein [Actinoplanes campanulatus]
MLDAVHVGRQPIFDAAGAVVAYELLFRGRLDAVESGRQDTYATSAVMVNTFTEFGIAEVVGNRPCFINLTREFVTGRLPLPFDPDQVVLEVLETVDVDDEVIAGLTALTEAGYRIALDDFVWGSGHERLLGLASYVKLDLLDGDLSRLDEIVAACRQYPGIQLVAERLETEAQVALADHYGMELRQGYALSRPQVLSTPSLSPSRLRRLELVAALMSPDVPLDKITTIIASDPALALRVLRVSNSVAAGVVSRISSVRQAIMMVGLNRIRRWATLMVVDDVGEAPEEQLLTALAQARLCESLAPRFGADPGAAFVAGLVTGMAGVMATTPAAMAEQLPLSAEVADAVIHGAGRLGKVLQTVQAYEDGEWGTGDLAGLSLDAMRWSTLTLTAANAYAPGKTGN